MLKRIGLLLLVAVVGSGCASQSQFLYQPSKAQENNNGAIVAVMSPLKDSREGNKNIDKIYSVKPLEEIQRIIHDELMSTGLFKGISFSEDNKDDDKADIKIEPSLTEMAWEVPNYEGICNIAFITGMLTGGIGGLIYGCTTTDVYGDTNLHIKIVETSSGNILIDKEYKGHCEEKTTKMICDTSGTKAKMVGNSLKTALESLKADLKKAIDKPKEGIALSGS